MGRNSTFSNQVLGWQYVGFGHLRLLHTCIGTKGLISPSKIYRSALASSPAHALLTISLIFSLSKALGFG